MMNEILMISAMAGICFPITYYLFKPHRMHLRNALGVVVGFVPWTFFDSVWRSELEQGGQSIKFLMDLISASFPLMLTILFSLLALSSCLFFFLQVKASQNARAK